MLSRRLVSTRFLARAATLLAFLLLAPGHRVYAGLPEAVARVKPSVVAVGTFQKTRSPPFVFRGTGFAVDDGTLVATNAHVVTEVLQIENSETMMVLVHVPGSREPQPREAKAVAVDKVHDLALLRITGAPLPTVALGNSESVRDGQSIAFTGFPIGNALGFYPVTHHGVIASLTPIAVPGATAGQLDARVIRRPEVRPVHPVSTRHHRLPRA